MTHQEIQNQEIIERFVRHQLPPDERRAFEEHYFDCEECFAEVQAMAQFIASVRHSSRRGALAESSVAAEPAWKSWFKPALIFAASAAVVLIVMLGYSLVRPSQSQPEDTAQKNDQKSGKTEVDNKTPTPQDLAINQAPRTPEPTNSDQVKLPAVLLDAERDVRSGGNQLTLPANATGAKLLIELDPGASFDSYQLQLSGQGKGSATSFNGLKANAKGLLTVTVPAASLPNGKFLVKLSGVKGNERVLVGEYNLTVRVQ